MIRLDDYWMGRDKAYADELTDEIRENAIELLGRVNLLLAWARADGVLPGIDMVTGTHVAGGWRPGKVNARTRNAAKGSTHIKADGIDVQDELDRPLARWCLRNLDLLEEVGLWMEDPQWTGGSDPWVHLQKVPPRSGRRVYIPNMLPPIAAKLPEQLGVVV